MFKKILLGIVALVVIGGIFGSGGGSDEPSTDTSTYAEETVAELDDAVEPADEEEPAAEAKPTKTAKPKPQYTSGQENAIAAAYDYLDYSAFSKTGLIEQLKFEGYGKDAVFAVNHMKVNYNQQAVAAAKDYLSYSSFSKSGLVEQLVFEGYTQAQANYGANRAY
jgi:hypothetical protein